MSHHKVEMASHRAFKPGEEVAFKLREALILGTVSDVEGDKLHLKPMNPKAKTKIVTRHIDKVVHARDLDPRDVQLATERGGHCPRRAMVSSIPFLTGKYHSSTHPTHAYENIDEHTLMSDDELAAEEDYDTEMGEGMDEEGHASGAATGTGKGRSKGGTGGKNKAT